MEAEKIRIALIGCGAIAHKHVIALRRIQNTEIVGVYDINSQAAKAFSEKYSLQAFANVERMIEDTDPKILNILTPSGNHAETILGLIRFNKHFIVEKPLALRLDQIDELLEGCDSRGLKVFVVQQNRFNPPIQQLKKALIRGRFGKLVLGTVRVRWCREQDYYVKSSWRGTLAAD